MEPNEFIKKNYFVVIAILLNIILCLWAISQIQAETNKHDEYYINLMKQYCPLAFGIGMQNNPPPFQLYILNITTFNSTVNSESN